FQSLQQYQAHLQEDFQASGDIVRFAIFETFRAVSALQQELFAALRSRQLVAQRLDLPRHHEWRKTAQRGDRPLERERVGVTGLLSGWQAMPARRVPVGQGM